MVLINCQCICNISLKCSTTDVPDPGFAVEDIQELWLLCKEAIVSLRILQWLVYFALQAWAYVSHLPVSMTLKLSAFDGISGVV